MDYPANYLKARAPENRLPVQQVGLDLERPKELHWVALLRHHQLVAEAWAEPAA